MGQVTIYIDPETEKRLNAMIKISGLSKSKWISDLIREKTMNEWPEGIARMAGAWKNFPDIEEIRKNDGVDLDREDF
jgi:hypothetical protein